MVTLPSDKDDLAIVYGEEDETDVSTNNSVRVPIVGANSTYLLHQFKVNHNNRDGVHVTIDVQSTLAFSSSTVYLQVWNEDDQDWETIAAANATAAGTDYEFDATLNENMADYYDDNLQIAFRLYQLNGSGSEQTLSVDLAYFAFITLYTETYQTQGTVYTDALEVKNTEYTDKYEVKNTVYTDTYESKNGE